jgi:hypothetical protein
MRSDRYDELVAIAEALEQLALEIRETAEEGTEGPETRAPAEPSPRNPGIGRGTRVRITINDRYRGRIGTVVGRRGTHYWDIQLDALDGGVSQLIYKKPSSFVVIDDQ